MVEIFYGTAETLYPNPIAELVTLNQLAEATLKRIIVIYAEGYKDKHKDRWLGESHFRNRTMLDTTSLLLMKVDDQIAGVINFNCERIIAACINNDFRGRKLGPELFRKATQFNNRNAWVTIDVEAEAMLWTVTTKDLGFQRVEDISKIESLFKGIRGTHPNDRFDKVLVENAVLTRRLGASSNKEGFMAFRHSEAVHGPNYQQFVFQHQS